MKRLYSPYFYNLKRRKRNAEEKSLQGRSSLTVVVDDRHDRFRSFAQLSSVGRLGQLHGETFVFFLFEIVDDRNGDDLGDFSVFKYQIAFAR